MTGQETTNDIQALFANPKAYDAATGIRVAQRAAKQTDRPLVIVSAPERRLSHAAIRGATETDQAVVLDTSIVGLFGPLSPLPPVYNEIAARDRRRRAGGLAAFVDAFTDRLTHLFVATVEKYDVARQLQWSFSDQAAPRILTMMRSMLGLGTAKMADLSPLPGDEILRYAGLFAQQTRSAEGLSALVGAETGLPVRIEQFHLRWRTLPLAEQSRMDGSTQLGFTSGAGTQVPDRAGQVRLVIGPVRYADFVTLEEGQPRLDRLRRLVKFYVGPVLDYDIQIILDRRDVPETQLGGDGPAPRLGWNSWARSAPVTNDSGDAVIGSSPRHNTTSLGGKV